MDSMHARLPAAIVRSIPSVRLMLTGLFLLAGALTLHGQSAIPSPQEEFGFRMGDDRELIDWKQITAYFAKIDSRSDRVLVQELGKSTLGKPFIMAIVSAEENIARLDRYREIQKALANPDELTPDAAAALVAEGKTVLLITLNIHSTEIASSQESVELLHTLATDRSPALRSALEQTIVLLVPSLNPDGQQMVTDWYRKTVGTPAEGSSPPELYHHYAGHDNNRDWFMYNLAESRHVARVLYHEWFPEIVYDQHQMGSSGPRLFMPPYEDPVNPNVPPALTAQVNLLGKYVVADLHSAGFRGVATGTTFNAFFEGTMSKTPLWHNRIGILSEAASVQIATPVWFPKGSVGGMGLELPENKAQTNHLDPWEGGWWRLRDIVEYELAVTRSIVDFAATFKTKIKTNFYELNRQAIAAGREKAPLGYFVPAGQHDPNAAAEMIERLRISGVRVAVTTAETRHGDRVIPAGSQYITLAQPARGYVKDLLEKQRYPDLKQYPGGPPRQPYDMTAWSLPLQMGVEVIEQTGPMNVPAIAVGDVSVSGLFEPGGAPASNGGSGLGQETGSHWYFERRYNNAFGAAHELLKRGIPLRQTHDSLIVGGAGAAGLAPGTFFVPADRLSADDAAALSKKWAVPLHRSDITTESAAALAPIARPRVAIYQPWLTSMDEGWTRLVMDEMGIEYTVLHNPDLKSAKAALREKFDVIILPDMGTNPIVSGKFGEDRGSSSEPVLGTPERPEEFKGGIGDEGVKALAAFVRAGGTLLTLGESSQFAIEKLRLPARDELKGLANTAFFAPGTILGITIDTENPLAYGMPSSVSAYFTEGQAFRLLPYTSQSRIIASYDEEDVLKSGWLVGGEKITGKTAMAEIPVEKGRVVMYGFRVQHRAQTHGTFKLFLNALFR